MSAAVWKLVDVADWEAARAGGTYAGSPIDLADGYVHMSGGDQLAETARRHYAGRTGLLLIELDPARLGDALKWEPSRGGALFPHLYGPVPFAACRTERPLDVDASGVMRFRDGAAGWD